MNMIVLCDQVGCIAVNGNQPIHLQKDLDNFKFLTEGKTVIYGRKTLETLPNKKPLSDRSNVILSKTLNEFDYIGYSKCNVHIFDDIADIIKLRDYIFTEDIFIIGGGSLYEAFLPFTNKVYMTQVNEDFGDLYCKLNPEENANKLTQVYFPLESMYKNFEQTNLITDVDYDKKHDLKITTSYYEFTRMK